MGLDRTLGTKGAEQNTSSSSVAVHLTAMNFVVGDEREEDGGESKCVPTRPVPQVGLTQNQHRKLQDGLKGGRARRGA